MKFTSVEEITALRETITAYIYEAIEVEKAGLKVASKPASEYPVPEELTQILENDASFKTAFEKLTPGRQKAYLMHFAAAKQSQTRISRIENYRDRILKGKGMHDCVCGLSKKMPGCDGSHKILAK